MKIRSARKDEVKKLQKLNQEVFIDNQQYDSDLIMDWATSELGKQYFTDVLNDPKSCCFIAEDNCRIIGCICCRGRKINYRKSKYIEIDNMGVLPEYRSKGLGTKLIKKSLSWAKTKGYQKMFVNSYFHNIKAIAFYKRNGFSEIDLSLERNI